MGSECRGEMKDNSQWRQLTVVTLSYCGLTYSPFEFYLNEYEHQLKTIGTYFQELIQQELKDFTDKKKGQAMFGDIEKKYKTRYSPMFKVMAGIQKIEPPKGEEIKYRFLSQQQFGKEWEREFQQECRKNVEFKEICKKAQNQKKLAQYKNNVRTYDFLMFKALLRYVYKERDFKKLITAENPRRYIKIIEPLFEFSFLDQSNKLSKFEYGFRKTNPDVYFLQEGTKGLIGFLQKRARRNYRWIADENGQTIIIKHQSFKNETFQIVDLDIYGIAYPKELTKKQFRPIALGTHSNNFLFISLHFSSRQQPNPIQMKYLNQILQKIKEKVSSSYKTVILGGNLNKFTNKFPQGFNYYPIEETDITTFKKRTKTQAQRFKNDLRDKRSIDKIITNQKIIQGEITMIDGTQPDKFEKGEKEKSNPERYKQEVEKCGKGLESRIKMLLPCEIHPFDKFLVKTIIEVPNYQSLSDDVKEVKEK